MNHLISIAGDAHPVPAQDGETILDALLRNGVGFAYSCQAGNCGACKCEYLAGEIVELEYSEQALSPAERARSVVLACRTQVRGDVHIRRLDTEEFVMHPSRVLQCRVGTLDALTHDVLRLRLTIESGGPFAFSPGQFAKLQFAFADAPRDYSMANAPHETGLEFHVRVLPGGVSERIREHLDVGDRVRVSGPFGVSYLRQKHRGPILAVAGSTGLAPIRSLVHAALRAGMPGPIHLYFGVREERDVYGEAELRQWMQAHPDLLRVHVVLSERAGEAGTRRTGLVTEAVAADLPDLTGFHAYLAGPPAMVDTAGELLRSRGMAARDIHADAFYRAVPAQPVPHVAV
ncbi:MAG: 2Fe-2S iron-sulfur cluster binding domain-containing protein [Burkholderiales bacterium]|nr:2Fe-2S iron-sulfur cluster binding domain-containing protein [Burkholderiales bacterium]